jgi:hypothetical protein
MPTVCAVLCARILFRKILHRVASRASFDDALLPIVLLVTQPCINFIMVSFNSGKRYIFS